MTPNRGEAESERRAQQAARALLWARFVTSPRKPHLTAVTEMRISLKSVRRPLGGMHEPRMIGDFYALLRDRVGITPAQARKLELPVIDLIVTSWLDEHGRGLDDTLPTGRLVSSPNMQTLPVFVVPPSQPIPKLGGK